VSSPDGLSPCETHRLAERPTAVRRRNPTGEVVAIVDHPGMLAASGDPGFGVRVTYSHSKKKPHPAMKLRRSSVIRARQHGEATT